VCICVSVRTCSQRAKRSASAPGVAAAHASLLGRGGRSTGADDGRRAEGLRGREQSHAEGHSNAGILRVSNSVERQASIDSKGTYKMAGVWRRVQPLVVGRTSSRK